MEKSWSTWPCSNLHNGTKRINHASVYVVKGIYKKYVEYLSELQILEQPSTTRFTEKLLHVLLKVCSNIISKRSVVLFFNTVSILVKDYNESPDLFLLLYERFFLLYEKNFLSITTIFRWIKFEVPKRIDSKKVSFSKQRAYRRIQ